MRAELEELATGLDANDSKTEALPHRSKYLLLASGYLRDLLALQRRFVDDVERELAETGVAASS